MLLTLHGEIYNECQARNIVLVTLSTILSAPATFNYVIIGFGTSHCLGQVYAVIGGHDHHNLKPR